MSNIKLKIVFQVVLIVFSINLSATHNRAGEITYRHISGYTYEFKVTTYTYTLSAANRIELEVNWGDNTTDIVPRDGAPVQLPNDYQTQSYTLQHTFPGPGIYNVTMEDPNRNLGVNNIPNSVNTVFSIKTTFIISPFTGNNSTPILLNNPIDKAAKGHIFIHNPGAYDPDGDSVSYELTICTAHNGEPIEGYEFPEASDTLYVDNSTGDLIWNSPVNTGKFNIALYVDEWRDGIRISRILRDMQVDVYETDNNPPVNSEVPDICVRAGDTITMNFVSTDADGDYITMDLVGGPLHDGKAMFTTLSAAGQADGIFAWRTTCLDAQKQPYTFVLKSQDIVVDDISLVDITSFNINVVHNPPDNLTSLPGTDTIRLEWDISYCGYVSGYNIYRKIGTGGFIPGNCETGVPEYTGYELLAKVPGRNNNYYVDDNLGTGLVPGYDYCYIVTAYYGDGAESIASNESCNRLVAGTPPMLGVSVQTDDETSGSILVSWALPRGVDTIDDGPYRYDLYQMEPGADSYTRIASIPSIDLTDTTYLVQNINTMIYPYFYSVVLYYQNAASQWIEVPGSEKASSLYLNLKGIDNAIEIDIQKRAPWQNKSFDIYRKPELSGAFQYLTNTAESFFVDTGLANQVSYTYRAISNDSRPLWGIDYNFQNNSHINTSEAYDSVPPCKPNLDVVSYCDSAYNILTWFSVKTLCGEKDNVIYNIFYKPTLEGEFQAIANVNSPDTSFIHNSQLESLAGVYGIVAVDSFNNVSEMDVVVIDSCQLYDLPNVFSPNGDNINDIYLAWNQGGFVKEVNMQIYNRYGDLVFETTNPDIEWDGYHMKTKKLVSTGVYYYICEVFESRLTGLNKRILKGFIHIYSGDSNIPTE